VNESTEKEFADFLDLNECTLHLFEVTHSDCLAVEHFADAVLRDDFFFRKGHWLSLISDSRVQLLVARVQHPGSGEWSEILGVVVLYADSVLHNLFLARWCRGLGLGSAIIEAISPSVIRAKVDMSSGDPTGFYNRLGFTHEEARKGKRGQIRILTKLGESTRAKNLKPKKKDVQNDPDVPQRDS
jgi:ribosomal protein S18 acetylase RimI-like enzyme